VAGTAGRFVAAALLCLLLLAAGARAATIKVDTTADDLTPNDGTVSLREAITAIDAGNNLGDPDLINHTTGTFGMNDTIDFNILGGLQPRQTILVGSTGNGALPALDKSITINGYTEPGASRNTLAHGDNAKILIALDGANAGANADGVLVSSTGADSTITGLDVFDFSSSEIGLQGGSNTVAGNDVGYDSTGAPTRSPLGIHVSASSNNIIGGTSPGARNLISGNLESGVAIVGTTSSGATGNLVEGNFIGTDPSGLHPAPNAFYSPNTTLGAVLIAGGEFNSIGGIKPGDGNVISGNGAGVNLTDGAQQNTVQGNLIGVAADGKTALGNRTYGIRVGSDDNLAPPNGPGQPNEPASSSNVIGANAQALAAGGGNVIAFNGGDGVLIQGIPQNNATQFEDSGNSVLRNSIFSNKGLGIDLQPKPPALRPNNLMPSPVITAVKPGSTNSTVHGVLHLAGHGGMTTLVELFASPRCGGGETFIGSVNTTTGPPTTNFSVPVRPLAPGQIITATATNTTADPTVPHGSASLFDTSEFSKCFAVPKRSSATKVACLPTGVRVGSATMCTATVSDSAPGHRITPSGPVHFSSSGNGSFSHSGSCVLSAGRCTVTFKPSGLGSGAQRITASYGGDSAHTGSTGHASLTVRRRKR
jgi:CSLREA domain-containing protein